MQISQLHLSSRLRRIEPPLARAAHTPLLGIATRSGHSRHLSLTIQAAKGFGKLKPTQDRPSEEEGPSKGRKGKAKRVKLDPGSVGPIPGQQRPQQQQPMAPFATQVLAPEPPSLEEEEFNARLRALKLQSVEHTAAPAIGSIAAAAASAATPAIFDAPASSSSSSSSPSNSDGSGNIYANPPPLSQTLLSTVGGGAAASDISDPKLRDANIGPSQLGLAAGAIVFVAVFVLVAAGDYAPSRRYKGVRPAQSPPDPIEEKILKGKVSLYEEQLRADPNSDDATEALATSYARLFEYDKAAGLLEKLSKRQPNNAEVWRLLGESSLLSQQPRKAVSAFERAVELRRQQQQQPANASPAPAPSVGVVTQPDLQLLTGLVDAYIANSDYPKAIDALQRLREELRRAATSTSSSGSSSGAAVVQKEAAASPQEEALAMDEAGAAAALVDGEAAAASTAAAVASSAAPVVPEMLTAPPLIGDADPSTSSQQPGGAEAPAAPIASSRASSSPASAVRPLDPVGVELLTAKVYSAWRGHEQDALATYDELIKAFPEDYRGYLAKGVFLKEKGRKADAERMFLQARFFAPASRQQLVRAIADSIPAAPELPDN